MCIRDRNNTTRTTTTTTTCCAFSFAIEKKESSSSRTPQQKGIPGITAIEYTANLRSKFFQLPYGDQCLSLPSSIFQSIGGYPDQCLFEDYELVRYIRLRYVAFVHGMEWNGIVFVFVFCYFSSSFQIFLPLPSLSLLTITSTILFSSSSFFSTHLKIRLLRVRSSYSKNKNCLIKEEEGIQILPENYKAVCS